MHAMLSAAAYASASDLTDFCALPIMLFDIASLQTHTMRPMLPMQSLVQNHGYDLSKYNHSILSLPNNSPCSSSWGEQVSRVQQRMHCMQQHF